MSPVTPLTDPLSIVVAGRPTDVMVNWPGPLLDLDAVVQTVAGDPQDPRDHLDVHAARQQHARLQPFHGGLPVL
jgi:hypothetical protein